MQSVQLAPYLVVQEGDSLMHELGRMRTTHAHHAAAAAGETGAEGGNGRAAAGRGSGHAYYARWERPGSTWVIATSIMSIGED